jgi:hypothetical protein
MPDNPEDESAAGTQPESGSARLSRLEHSLDANREETTRLTGSVQDLATAIEVVTNLRREQQEATEQSKAAAKKTEVASARVDERADEVDEKAGRIGKVTRLVVVGVLLAVFVASTLAFVATNRLTVDLLNERRQESYRTCLTRNQTTMSNVRRELALAAAETDRRLSDIHRRSAVELRLGIVDCARTQRPVR